MTLTFISPEDAITTIRENRGVGQEINLPPGNTTSLDFNLDRLANPATFRPLENRYRQPRTTWQGSWRSANYQSIIRPNPDPKRRYGQLVFNPKEGKIVNREHTNPDWQIRHDQKPGATHTKKLPCTLIPGHGRMLFFHQFAPNLIKNPVGLLFDERFLALKGEKYVFAFNAYTNARWWFQEMQYACTAPNPKDYGHQVDIIGRPLSMPLAMLRAQINAQREFNDINECLFGFSAQALRALFVQREITDPRERLYQQGQSQTNTGRPYSQQILRALYANLLIYERLRLVLPILVLPDPDLKYEQLSITAISVIEQALILATAGQVSPEAQDLNNWLAQHANQDPFFLIKQIPDHQRMGFCLEAKKSHDLPQLLSRLTPTQQKAFFNALIFSQGQCSYDEYAYERFSILSDMIPQEIQEGIQALYLFHLRAHAQRVITQYPTEQQLAQFKAHPHLQHHSGITNCYELLTLEHEPDAIIQLITAFLDDLAIPPALPKGLDFYLKSPNAVACFARLFSKHPLFAGSALASIQINTPENRANLIKLLTTWRPTNPQSRHIRYGALERLFDQAIDLTEALPLLEANQESANLLLHDKGWLDRTQADLNQLDLGAILTGEVMLEYFQNNHRYSDRPDSLSGYIQHKIHEAVCQTDHFRNIPPNSGTLYACLGRGLLLCLLSENDKLSNLPSLLNYAFRDRSGKDQPCYPEWVLDLLKAKRIQLNQRATFVLYEAFSAKPQGDMNTPSSQYLYSLALLMGAQIITPSDFYTALKSCSSHVRESLMQHLTTMPRSRLACLLEPIWTDSQINPADSDFFLRLFIHILDDQTYPITTLLRVITCVLVKTTELSMLPPLPLEKECLHNAFCHLSNNPRFSPDDFTLIKPHLNHDLGYELQYLFLHNINYWSTASRAKESFVNLLIEDNSFREYLKKEGKVYALTNNNLLSFSKVLTYFGHEIVSQHYSRLPTQIHRSDLLLLPTTLPSPAQLGPRFSQEVRKKCWQALRGQFDDSEKQNAYLRYLLHQGDFAPFLMPDERFNLNANEAIKFFEAADAEICYFDQLLDYTPEAEKSDYVTDVFCDKIWAVDQITPTWLASIQPTLLKSAVFIYPNRLDDFLNQVFFYLPNTMDKERTALICDLLKLSTTEITWQNKLREAVYTQYKKQALMFDEELALAMLVPTEPPTQGEAAECTIARLKQRLSIILFCPERQEIEYGEMLLGLSDSLIIGFLNNLDWAELKALLQLQLDKNISIKLLSRLATSLHAKNPELIPTLATLCQKTIANLDSKDATTGHVIYFCLVENFSCALKDSSILKSLFSYAQTQINNMSKELALLILELVVHDDYSYIPTDSDACFSGLKYCLEHYDELIQTGIAPFNCSNVIQLFNILAKMNDVPPYSNGLRRLLGLGLYSVHKRPLIVAPILRILATHPQLTEEMARDRHNLLLLFKHITHQTKISIEPVQLISILSTAVKYAPHTQDYLDFIETDFWKQLNPWLIQAGYSSVYIPLHRMIKAAILKDQYKRKLGDEHTQQVQHALSVPSGRLSTLFGSSAQAIYRRNKTSNEEVNQHHSTCVDALDQEVRNFAGR